MLSIYSSQLVRRRENMVGVNMVLAESIKFKYGLYKSCGVECFEGIMLEPCLLQPCFHVAGIYSSQLVSSRAPAPARQRPPGSWIASPPKGPRAHNVIIMSITISHVTIVYYC